MGRKILHCFVFSFFIVALPMAMAQDPEINVPLTFRFGAGGTGLPSFSGVNHAFGMGTNAAIQAGLDQFDEDDLLPPSGPIEVDVASFRIGNVNSAKDFRPIASSASYLLDLEFSSSASEIILEWNPALFKAGGSVFDASVANATIGGSTTVGFDIFQIRETTGTTVLVDLQNPVNGGNVNVIDATTAQYTFADPSGFKTVQIVLGRGNAAPFAVDDPQVFVFKSSPSPAAIDVKSNDIETDFDQDISLLDGSFPTSFNDGTFSVAMGTLAKSSSSDVLEFDPDVSAADFSSNNTDRFTGTFQYSVQDNASSNQAESNPATVTVTVFNNDIIVDRTLSAAIAKAGEGEDIWIDVDDGGAGVANEYNDGVDTKIFDGSPGTNFSNGFLTDGVPGIMTGILYNNSVADSAYTVGEDIWQDVDSSGTYNAGDIPIFDGGDGWTTPQDGTVSGLPGLRFHDADENGQYTHDETADLGLTVTLNVKVLNTEVTDLTKLTIKETLPNNFIGLWYIPVRGYGSTANSEVLELSSPELEALSSDFLPKVSGNGTNREITFSWTNSPTPSSAIPTTFNIIYRVVGPRGDLEKKTATVGGTGFVNSEATFDPDDTVSDDEFSALIANSEFQPAEEVAHPADMNANFQISFNEITSYINDALPLYQFGLAAQASEDVTYFFDSGSDKFKAGDNTGNVIFHPADPDKNSIISFSEITNYINDGLPLYQFGLSSQASEDVCYFFDTGSKKFKACAP